VIANRILGSEKGVGRGMNRPRHPAPLWEEEKYANAKKRFGRRGKKGIGMPRRKHTDDPQTGGKKRANPRGTKAICGGRGKGPALGRKNQERTEMEGERSPITSV